jgi:hypothetical protein
MQSEDHWQPSRDRLIQFLIKRLESLHGFDEYREFLPRLRDVINDSKVLSDVMHNQITSQLKVTLNQCHIIYLFEFGFPVFSESSICDMQNINNDEAPVGIFYAVTGFVDSSELPTDHIVM